MTAKESELHYVVLRLAESGQLAQLTKLMLGVESRMEKLERVVDAAKEAFALAKKQGVDYPPPTGCTSLATMVLGPLDLALAALEDIKK